MPEDLGTLGGDSYAFSINDSGHVAGHAFDANGDPRAFVWTEGGGMVDIGDLGGGAMARGINNDGLVTGWSPTSSHERAFRYTPGDGGLPGTMEDLGDFGFYQNPGFFNHCGGYDINNAGHVVGRAGNLKKIKHYYTPKHAFLYTDEDGMIDLGTLGGYQSSAAGINSTGEVVGGSEEVDGGPYHGFLYTNKTETEEFVMVKLEDLVEWVNGEPAEYQGGPIAARKINDSGQICGDADGQAILLTPVEP